MYDLSKEFEKFYNDYVVLPNKEQNDLRNKKNINIKRLKDIKLQKQEYREVWQCIQWFKMIIKIMI